MLNLYNNEAVTYTEEGKAKLIERYDLHYNQGSSDKIYICTLQEVLMPESIFSTTMVKTYYAVSFYGRRGAVLSSNLLGRYRTLADAHKEMTRQMKTKTKKGYVEVGSYIDADAKATANGALGAAVLQFLRETYPVGSVVESPSGKQGIVLNLLDNGALHVSILDEPIPFGQYGQLKVI